MKLVLFVMVVLSLLAVQAGAKDGAEESSEPAALADTEPSHLRTECALNLVEMSKRLNAFALTRNGGLPSKLSEAYIGAPRSALGELVCPSAKPDVVPGGFHPSYAYVNIVPGGWALQGKTADILVFDREPVHDGGRNVLLADLETVVHMKEADFQAALAEQQKRWKAQDKELVVVQDDFIPLRDPLDLRPVGAPSRSWRSLFSSIYFKVAATLVLAIAAIVMILLLRERERGRATSDQ